MSRSRTLGTLIALRRLVPALALWLAAGMAAAAPAVGDTLRLTATRLDGSRVSLDEARGRRALLVLWSPDSLAWRKSMGEFERFAASPEAANVFVLAISTNTDATGIRNFMAARKAGFPVALRGEDNLGRFDDDKLPVVLVIDREGRLLRHHAGMFISRNLRDLLAPTDQ